MASNSTAASTGFPRSECLVQTESTVVQQQTEKECQPYFLDLTKLPEDQKANLERLGLLKEDRVRLLRRQHRAYLEGVWTKPLKAPFVSLDSSRPWMLYWCLHGYDLLRQEENAAADTKQWITARQGRHMVATLEDCWQGYHTAVGNVPVMVDATDPLYFSSHEDDQSNASYYCGGFGGGPGQMAHAATTYAAVLALCILATCSPQDDSNLGEDEEDNDGDDKDPATSNADDDDADSYEALHYSDRALRLLRELRIPLYRWMASLQVVETGGYRMQHDGEVDVRATYTIACCAKLLGLLETPHNQLTVLGRPLVIDFVKSCQTYEGGMGGEPYSEAHGGYTFCAVAALELLDALDDKVAVHHGFSVANLVGWLGRRQFAYEGGFGGRSNKLVDGCYSFWQGGAVAIASSKASRALLGTDAEEEEHDAGEDPWLARYHAERQPASSTTPSGLPFPLLYDVYRLERYILLCAQEIKGGLRDKPSKPRDFYHSCYNLSGLSVAQHCGDGSAEADDPTAEDTTFGDPEQTLVGRTHPCYNLRIERVARMLAVEW